MGRKPNRHLTPILGGRAGLFLIGLSPSVKKPKVHSREEGFGFVPDRSTKVVSIMRLKKCDLASPRGR